ncbi:MAG: AAA family ATPase [Ruminococcus sp.]|nr:AAA family ATPase [Ruminococcus sp.]
MKEIFNSQGVERVHVYTEKDGKPLAEKHIIKQPDGSKKCFWYAIDPQTGAKTFGLNGMELPLYHADRLHNQSINGDEDTPIFFAEGEKDVKTLEEIFEAVATCTPNGGTATSWKDSYNNDLKKRNIIILTDNDAVGEKYGLTVARNTVDLALSIKIIPAKTIWSDCPEHGDISDIVQALGEDKARELLADAIQKTEYYFKLDDDVDISDFEELLTDSPEILQEPKLVAKKGYEFEKKPIRYIWYPYIPAGDYTVLMAAGGTGKTYFACGVAATISKGEALPVPNGYEDKQIIPENKNVLIISAEDRGSDIWERLEKSGADVEYVHIADKTESNGFLFPKNSEDTARIKYFENAIKDYKPNLIIIDPWHAFCPPEVDVNRINHVRPIFQTLSSICEKYDCGLILISHINKKPQENANNAALGSVDLINASRSALTVVADSNDKNNRFVVHTKINHAEHGQTVQFKISDDGFAWNGFEPSMTKDTLEDAARMHRKPSEEIKDQPLTDEEIKEDLLEAITELAECGKETKIAYQQLENMLEDKTFRDFNTKKKKKLIEEVSKSEEFQRRGIILKGLARNCKYTNNITGKSQLGRGILVSRT